MKSYDLETFQSAAEHGGNGRLFLTLGRNSTSRRVTGLQKLVQRYILIFLTEQGSVPSRPDYGTTFITRFNAGRIRNRGDVLNEFSFANFDTVVQLQATQTDEDPVEEKIKSAVLVDFTIDYSVGRLYLKIRLYTEAGEYAELIIPTK